ncbi:mucolipin-3-like isoform X4 [Ruditapes philippinarum]|uniref:mucolipin-3-like isoform X4 n=1 Tax=Ruditapes philippinarum TaxID=129788 RepID=UPI00295B8B7D|nr:mucolipin-3-like isoform X4 [Ruditapes philippinarum]
MELEINDKNTKRKRNKVTDYEDEAKRLRRLLRLYFYSAFKFKGNICNFHFIYCFVFLMQIIKVALLTTQMIHFGNDRGNFSSVVNRGGLVLRHLLLEHWDASWETLPYPPAQGDFAVYTIDDLESGINYAVKNYYNAEREAIGYYVRTADDKMTATMKYFDFPGFHGASTGEGITISEITFPIDKGLSAEVTQENETMYSYNITREFDHHNMSQPIKRMLSTTLRFKLHSVRSHEMSKKATCLRVEGSLEFVDLDNNGQVLVDLDTRSSRIKCKDMNLPLSDWQLENTSEEIGASVIAFCVISLVLTTATMFFAAYTFWQSELELELLDSYTVWLGVGCVLAWISLLKFFKFHNKFHLLFSTLYKAFWDVIAYLICVGVLFVGFWVCGYVVLAPYHVKFKTPTAAGETLFSVVNGDEIYATLAILESDKSGGNWVWWFSRFYFGAYVAIFTIVVINLLIALFMSAYESIKTYYEDKPDERELGPLEKALRRVLIQDGEGSNLRSSIYDLMNDSLPLTSEINSLRTELSKIVRVSKNKKDVELLKPRTLKVFMEDEEHKMKKFKCGFVSCSFTFFSGDDQITKDDE